MNLSKPQFSRRQIIYILAWAIILMGAFLRLFVYIENRNLMMDEINVVRNLYERDFSRLMELLDYNQCIVLKKVDTFEA